MTSPAPHPVQILPLGDCDGVVLEPVISPLPTAVEAIRDLVTGGAPAVLSDSQAGSCATVFGRARCRP